MSHIISSAIDICRKIIGEKTTATDLEIASAIENITCMPMYKDVDRTILKDELLSLYSVKVGDIQILEGKERRTPWTKI